MNASTLSKRFLMTAAVAALVLAGPAVRAEGPLKETLEKTYPIEADGRIDLSNVNGPITITAWDRDEVKLVAVKSGKKQEHLDEVKIEIAASDERIKIKTKLPEKKRGSKNNSTSVAYTLTVPRGIDLDKINNVNGSIEIEGVEGEISANAVNGHITVSNAADKLDLSTVNAPIKAEVASLKGSQSMKLNSVNGRVELTLPPKPDATIDAHTLNGGIRTVFLTSVKKHWPVGKSLKGTIGRGGSEIEISTVNGSIEILGAKIEKAAALEKN